MFLSPDSPFPKKLILGSASPRRRQLLAQLGFPFEVRTQPIDETIPSRIAAHEAARYLAREKNLAQDIGKDELLLTADTTVVYQHRILDKPTDIQAARRTLEQLSGKVHTVITGVCMRTTSREHCFQATTEVRFRPLSDDLIDYYLKKYQPMDKAGAYGIQDWIGLVGVAEIRGDYYNVVGLPVGAVYEQLLSFV